MGGDKFLQLAPSLPMARTRTHFLKLSEMASILKMYMKRTWLNWAYLDDCVSAWKKRWGNLRPFANSFTPPKTPAAWQRPKRPWWPFRMPQIGSDITNLFYYSLLLILSKYRPHHSQCVVQPKNPSRGWKIVFVLSSGQFSYTSGWQLLLSVQGDYMCRATRVVVCTFFRHSKGVDKIRELFVMTWPGLG